MCNGRAMSGVKSIERAFAVLRELSRGPAGVTEIAEELQLPKSTVARLLGALQSEGVVEQEGYGLPYHLGEGLADLAGAVVPGESLIATARPHLQYLAAQSEETAGLSVLAGFDVLYIAEESADTDVTMRDWTGERTPLHVTASGLVLLAAQPPEFIDSCLKRRLKAMTSNTVTDPEVLRKRLGAIDRSGYAWARREYRDDIVSVAAPVRASERVVAALHVHGPSYRFPVDEDVVTAIVVDAAARLSDTISAPA